LDSVFLKISKSYLLKKKPKNIKNNENIILFNSIFFNWIYWNEKNWNNIIKKI